MNQDYLNLGLRQLQKRSAIGELASQALRLELARLYQAAYEPLPELLADCAPPTDDSASDTESSLYAARYLYETIHDGEAETDP